MGGKRKSGDGPGRSAPKVKAVKVEDAGGASAAEFEYVERFRQWWQGTKSIVFYVSFLSHICLLISCSFLSHGRNT